MTRGSDVAGGVTGVGSHSGARRLRRVLKGQQGGIIKRLCQARINGLTAVLFGGGVALW